MLHLNFGIAHIIPAVASGSPTGSFESLVAKNSSHVLTGGVVSMTNLVQRRTEARFQLTDRMSKLQILLVLLAVLLQCSLLVAAFQDPQLTPPAGFSKTMTANTFRGRQIYTCNRGIWVKEGASADLVDATKSKVASYKSNYNPNTRRSIMSWTIINSAGAAGESGAPTCGITGVPVYQVKSITSSIDNYLAEVTGHHGSGAGDLMSFVVLIRTSGGAPPADALCDARGQDGATTSVPFSGTFEFYNQDSQAPPLPASFTPKGKYIQGSFCKGKVVFQFNGKKWLRKGLLATLYDVAGGNVIGKFGTITKPDKFGGNLHFQFDNPNFWVTGKLCARPLTVSTSSCPWQVMTFTTEGGTAPYVGPYKSAQLTSTRGGAATTLYGATAGMTWSSPFTGLVWFYGGQ